MSAIEQVAERFRNALGSKVERYLGEITPLMIRRYALAIADDNPVYHDKGFAQSLGYPDVLAPPNMLASIVEWGVGGREEDLRRDGTQIADDSVPLGSMEGVRIKGGGEEMFFYRPVVAGTHVTLTSEIIDTYTKQGKKGPIAFLVIKNTYRDQDGALLSTCNRTVLVH